MNILLSLGFLQLLVLIRWRPLQQPMKLSVTLSVTVPVPTAVVSNMHIISAFYLYAA